MHGRSYALALSLRVGARANVTDKSGTSPLLLAVVKRDAASVRLLAETGADLELGSGTRTITPLVLAVEQDDVETAQYLAGQRSKRQSPGPPTVFPR